MTQAPTVSGLSQTPAVPTLTGPANNVVLAPGDSVTLSATSPDGDLNRIDFVLDPSGPGTGGTIIATDSSSPYSQPWTVAGSFAAHTIVARAVRNGIATDSAAINITIWSPSALGADLHAWYRADTEISLGTPPAVATWGNGAGAGLDLTQATGSSQPTLVNPDSRFNNKPAIEFDGTADFLQASTAADWKCLHDGTGMSVMIVWYMLAGTTSNRVLLDTLNGTGSNVGFEIFVDTDDPDERVTLQISNGSANPVLQTSPIDSALNATRHVLCVAYGEGFSPNEWEFRLDSVAVAAGNSAAAPSSSNPFGALTVGRFVSGGGFLRGAIAEIVIAKRRLSTAELQQYEAYAARFAA